MITPDSIIDSRFLKSDKKLIIALLFEVNKFGKLRCLIKKLDLLNIKLVE